jgi:hypothetical protein
MYPQKKTGQARRKCAGTGWSRWQHGRHLQTPLQRTLGSGGKWDIYTVFCVIEVPSTYLSNSEVSAQWIMSQNSEKNWKYPYLPESRIFTASNDSAPEAAGLITSGSVLIYIPLDHVPSDRRLGPLRASLIKCAFALQINRPRYFKRVSIISLKR